MMKNYKKQLLYHYNSVYIIRFRKIIWKWLLRKFKSFVTYLKRKWIIKIKFLIITKFRVIIENRYKKLIRIENRTFIIKKWNNKREWRLLWLTYNWEVLKWYNKIKYNKIIEQSWRRKTLITLREFRWKKKKVIWVNIRL